MNVNLSKGILWTIAAIFLHSSGHAAVGAISAKIPIYQIQFLQYSIAASFLFLYFGKEPLQKPTYPKIYLFRCISGISAAFTFILSIRYLTLFNATLLNGIGPFYLPLIGTLWLKEKPSPLIWPLLGLGFCGTVLIFPPTLELFQSGAIFALISGVFSALALSSVRALAQRDEPAPRVVLIYMIFGSCCTGILSLFTWESLNQWEWMLAVFAGFCMSTNQICIFRSFRYATASSLAPFSYFSFLFSAAIGWLVYRQPIDNQILWGALLIGLTGILTHRIHRMRQAVRQ